MNRTRRIKTATRVWMSILALTLILLSGAATAETGNGSGASGEQGLAASLASFFQPVADWFLAVIGLDNHANGEGTGEPEKAVGSGTGEPEKAVGSGTGLVSETGQGTDKGAGSGTG